MIAGVKPVFNSYKNAFYYIQDLKRRYGKSNWGRMGALTDS